MTREEWIEAVNDAINNVHDMDVSLMDYAREIVDRVIFPALPVWRTMESAPKDGEQFLALLSNGWRALLQYPVGQKGRYLWWVTTSNVDLPVVETHPYETDWASTNAIIATHWMPLPTPPEGK